MENKRFFFLITALDLINATNYVFIVPILPDTLLKKGLSLTSIGIILSFYQISHICTALYLGNNLRNFSRFKVMVLGQIFLVASNLAFCCLKPVTSTALLFFLAAVIRFFQGLSFPLVISTIYTFVPILFKEDMQKKFAVLEIITGLGLSLGPVIGGVLYGQVGYIYSFVIISCLYLLTGICIYPLIKSKIEAIQNESLLKAMEDEKLKEEKEKEPPRKLSILEIATNKSFLLTLAVYIISLMCYFVIQPGFSAHIHSYGYGDEVVGLLFGLGDFTYALTGFLIVKIADKIGEKRKYMFVFGGFLSAVSLFILGPEDYSGLPTSIVVIIIGMVVLGSSQMFYMPIVILELMEIFNEIDAKAKGKEEMASGIFSAGLSITSLIGSIFGGILTDHFGFNRGMSIYALVILGYLVIYSILSAYLKYTKKKKQVNGLEQEIADDFL